MAAKDETARRGEQNVSAYLQNMAYKILHRNWHHSHYEIDIIATKDETLHFIEVKSLSTDEMINPEQHVTTKKFDSLKKAAAAFLEQHPGNSNVQFDVLAITMKDDQLDFFLIQDVYL